MTLTSLDYLTMFFSNLFVVFLLGLQSRNVVAGRIFAAIVTSFGISVANFIFVKYATRGSYDVFAVCAAGGCVGITLSILFYRSFMEKKLTQDTTGNAVSKRTTPFWYDADKTIRDYPNKFNQSPSVGFVQAAKDSNANA